MEQRLMSVLTNFARHTLGTLRSAFRKIFIGFLVTALIAAIITEVVGGFMSGAFQSGHFLPDGTVHLAAAAIAIVFGYAVAVTIAIEEIISGIVKGIEVIVQETEKLAGEAIREVEKGIGAVEHDALSAGRSVLHGASGVEQGVAGAFRG
ncbi:MAG TPA: hypothetical protein VF807_08125, partial [Ktedonobacterales bacterium]